MGNLVLSVTLTWTRITSLFILIIYIIYYYLIMLVDKQNIFLNTYRVRTF